MRSHFATLFNRLSRFLFPDSPTNAWFLTPEERGKAVKRIQVSPSYPYFAVLVFRV